jgi:plasmid stability protein
MKKLTISLDDKTANAVRLRAATQGVSMSLFLANLVREHVQSLHRYEAAYGAWRAEKPLRLRGAYPKRDELYDRVPRRDDKSHD